jgi:hypothetical protein
MTKRKQQKDFKYIKESNTSNDEMTRKIKNDNKNKSHKNHNEKTKNRMDIQCQHNE